LKKLNAYDINKDLLNVFLNIIEGVHQSRDPRDLEKLMKDISLGLGDKQTLQKNNF